MDLTDHDIHGRELTWSTDATGLAGAGPVPGGLTALPVRLPPVLAPDERPIAESGR